VDAAEAYDGAEHHGAEHHVGAGRSITRLDRAAGMASPDASPDHCPAVRPESVCSEAARHPSVRSQPVAPVPARPQPRQLALFGLPHAVAEPVTMLAEILGWQVLQFPEGPAIRPPARACLAMLPACAAASSPPLVLWSPERNLNEHISRAGLSIMDQPLCITRVEQMLEALGCDP
jgi:hypothetical protein